MLNRFQFGKRGIVPNLVIAQRVLDKMMTASKQHLEDETGEAMIGLVVTTPHSGTTLYVLDTISPDESAVRHYHTFQQGDDRQDEILWWLRENWRVYRSHLSDQIAPDNPLKQKLADAPLHYLGDWHKQPGHMIHPSGGDLMTALDWIFDEDNSLGFMLAPILTMDYPTIEETGGVTTNFIYLPAGDGSTMRVDFWYIDRKTKMFEPITPAVYQEKDLPALPPYPWHLVDQARFDAECERLRNDGMFLSVTLWDADGELPLEVCFLLARMDSDKMLIITTPHDYPKHAPSIRIAPFVAMDSDQDMYDVFEKAWSQSKLIDSDEMMWSADRWLLDFIHEIELKQGLRTAEQIEAGGGSGASAVASLNAPMTSGDAETADKEKSPSAGSMAVIEKQPDTIEPPKAETPTDGTSTEKSADISTDVVADASTDVSSD